ncbi:hypothetical protein G6Z94_19210, partial [Vibrio aestuarianus]|uniref:hypothetical protein n=2 Tax=Vibrio aestuarianus TaxID=28171 RepID=UPI0015943C50
GGACWKTHYRQKLTVGSWAVMAVIYYVAMISHQGLIRIFPRYLWPSKSGENSIHKKRALKLRQALEITDDSPLKNRKLRNQMEHFDERLDNYLAQDIVGEFIPAYVDFEPLNVGHPVHIFKAFYINRREFVLLGETHKMQYLCKELLRVHELLEQFSRAGHRLG